MFVDTRIIPAYAGSTGHHRRRSAGLRDHPRIRGEHPRAPVTIDQGAGSSPHTRGARLLYYDTDSAIRIIPAYAGSTPSRSSPTWQTSDHPRIRGEHDQCTTPGAGGRGSSPHTRGARAVDGDLQEFAGIIPAYAGSTASALVDWTIVTDHPRIRGEHLWMEGGLRGGVGSSPHTRGALGVESCRLMWFWDHPRIRGEHLPPLRLLPGLRGSSPHTRGAHVLWGSVTPVARIIPAYAGSTSFLFFVTRGRWDHPRIRGEHLFRVRRSPCGVGSSPHTRGALSAEGGRHFRGRIIPAYAGSTCAAPWALRRRMDHPRIRGEHLERAGGPPAQERIIPAYAGSTSPREPAPRPTQGSSPHTRGAPFPCPAVPVWGGIIPAYAGSTNGVLVGRKPS